MRRLCGDGGDRGSAVVEFALVLPILLLVVFGLVDFGRMFNTQIVLTQAAREGARLDALNQSSSNVVSRTQAAAPTLTGMSVSVTSCPVPATSSSDAVVVTSQQFTFVTPIGAMAAMFGSTGVGAAITLTGRGVMPCGG